MKYSGAVPLFSHPALHFPLLLISTRPCEFPAESQSAREYLIPMLNELDCHTYTLVCTKMENTMEVRT